MIKVFGEILVDRIKKPNTDSFENYLGGAPFNVSYAIKQISDDVIFYGNVGNDEFGLFLIDEAKKCGFDTSTISMDKIHPTTEAVVINDDNGERHFYFKRSETADYYMPFEALNNIKENDIVHLGSLMLSEDIGYEFAKKLIQVAKNKKAIISFDVNYRDDIYKSPQEAIDKYKEICSYCDILKVSEDELALLTSEVDLMKALKIFTKENQKVFVTLGKEGSLVYFNNKTIKEGSISVTPIDTTGAGDAFFGTMLGLIDRYGYLVIFNDETLLKQSLRKANIQGAFATTAKGALGGVVHENILNEYMK